MKLADYKESKARGSFDFPVEAYHLHTGHPRYRMPVHWHEEFEIIYVFSGGFSYEIGQKSGVARAGDLLFVNSGVFHGGIPQRGEYGCIVFDLNALVKEGGGAARLLAPFLSGGAEVLTRLPAHKSTVAPVTALFSVLTEKPQGFELVAQGLIFQFFGALVQGEYFKPASDKAGNKKQISQLKDALYLIENEYSSPLTLDQLALSANMSSKYFCSFFKQMTSFTPIEYLNRHRIEVACYRMQSGWRNMTELTYECGFNDLSYFIRVFKSIMGVTPKQYALAQERTAQ